MNKTEDIVYNLKNFLVILCKLLVLDVNDRLN